MDPAAIRDAVLDLLLEAYEDAGLQGLCGEGRWEAAVGAVRAASAQTIARRAGAPDPETPITGDGMSEEWRPAGYNQASPYLIVDGAQRSIGFLEAVFGAEPLRSFAADDGRVMHAEVRIGDTVVMLADAAEGWPTVGAHVHVYVPDVDATYRRALAAGAESVQEPVRKGDEDRRGGVKDAGGTTWWIATREG